jgi:peptidase S41-like protein
VQFSAWLAAFNSANRDTLLAYHEQHFPYSVASVDVASVEREQGLSVGTQGFTERAVEESSPTRVTVLLEERGRRQFARVQLEVDADPPHHVVHFEIGPIPTPAQFLSPAELEQRRLDGPRRQAAIDTLGKELEAHYVFADVAKKMADRLREKSQRGDYASITDAAALADILSEDLRQVSHDKHLGVHFGPPPPPPPDVVQSEEPPPWMLERNFGFGSITRLPGNVALLSINGFVPLLGDAVKRAIGDRMSEIADADAVIIDLQNNGGGAPPTVALVASYFFGPQPVHLNSIVRRDTGETQEFWTEATLAGARFGADKPVYILTSGRTFSGGEDLAYSLQAQHRAVVVGEVTGGGAHPTEPRAIDANLFVSMPWGRSINPITGTNWEGVGVKPDLPVPAPQALQRALDALSAKLEKQENHRHDRR